MDVNGTTRSWTRGALLVGMVLATGATGATAGADAIRLMREAETTGETIRLGEVARLDGPAAEELAELELGSAPAGDGEARLTLDAVRRRLTQAGVNWGRLTLSGYRACVVRAGGASDDRRGDAGAGGAGLPTEETVMAEANPRRGLDLGAAEALRGLIVRTLTERAGVPGQEVVVELDESAWRRLAEAAPGGRYEVEPRSRGRFGRVVCVVRRHDGGAVAERFTVLADVRWRTLAAVATRTIRRGESFGRDAVAVREVLLDDDRGEPVRDLSLLMGQTCDTVLREGDVVDASAVVSPALVERGQMVTVRCVSGALVVRTTLRAMEEGGDGDVIRLRHDVTRQEYRAQVTGPGRAVMWVGGSAGTPGAADGSNQQDQTREPS